MGTTIGNVLISYDVDRLHAEVKSTLEALGYFESFENIGDPKEYTLPDTTLWHPHKSSNLAMTELNTVCDSLGVTLEKAVAIRVAEFVGIYKDVLQETVQ